MMAFFWVYLARTHLWGVRSACLCIFSVFGFYFPGYPVSECDKLLSRPASMVFFGMRVSVSFFFFLGCDTVEIPIFSILFPLPLQRNDRGLRVRALMAHRLVYTVPCIYTRISTREFSSLGDEWKNGRNVMLLAESLMGHRVNKRVRSAHACSSSVYL